MYEHKFDNFSFDLNFFNDSYQEINYLSHPSKIIEYDSNSPFQIYLSRRHKFQVSIVGSSIINFEYYLLNLLREDESKSLLLNKFRSPNSYPCQSIMFSENFDEGNLFLYFISFFLIVFFSTLISLYQ